MVCWWCSTDSDAGQGSGGRTVTGPTLHITAFVNRPKDVQDSPAVPEEFSFTAFLASFLFLRFLLCVCVCACEYP